MNAGERAIEKRAFVRAFEKRAFVRATLGAAIAIAVGVVFALPVACSTSVTVLPPKGSGDDSGTSCPASVAGLSIPMWKAPQKFAAGACSDTDLAAFTMKASDANASYMDIYAALTGDTCKACIFSSFSDATWQPVVWDPTRTSGNAFANFGACYAIVSGSETCGSAVESADLCLSAACADTCVDQASCLGTAAADGCKMQTDALDAACGAKLPSFAAACATLVLAVDVLCGAGSAGDAGAKDSGAKDGGDGG